MTRDIEWTLKLIGAGSLVFWREVGGATSLQEGDL
jgi:hypothetical protein